MISLTLGNKVPLFSLKDKDGILHSLNTITSDFIVVYFYPKDDTPGCTIEAQMFNNELENFKEINVQVLGISGGDEKTKTKFCEKHDLKILLLSDPDFSVAKSYDSYGKKAFMGKEYFGILRKTFILDKEHNLLKIYDDAKPAEHAKEVLIFLKEFKK